MINVKRVILIRSHFPDNRLEKEAETLANNGYSVTQLVWDRGRMYSNNNEKNNIKKMKLKVQSGSFKVAFYLPLWWIFVIFQLIIRKWDIVHAADFDTYLPALIVSKIKRKPIVYDIFDFYAEMIEFPVFKELSRKIFGYIDKSLMKSADLIIIADESRIKQIGENANKNIVTIYNSPKDVIDQKNEFENDKFRIFFGGWVSKDKSIDKVILAVKDLENVDLTIMGFCDPWNYEQELERLSKNIDNVKLFLKAVPHKKIIENTIKSDLIFAFYDPLIPNNKYASPNKLFEAMMCGKPIIVNDNTAMANIVRSENCGIVIPYGDIKSIKNSIIKLRDNTELYNKLASNARNAYEKKYNWPIMERKLFKAYTLFYINGVKK